MRLGNRTHAMQFVISSFALIFLWGAVFYLFGIGTAVWTAALDMWEIVFPTFLYICRVFAILILIAIKRYKTIHIIVQFSKKRLIINPTKFAQYIYPVSGRSPAKKRSTSLMKV